MTRAFSKILNNISMKIFLKQISISVWKGGKYLIPVQHSDPDTRGNLISTEKYWVLVIQTEFYIALSLSVKKIPDVKEKNTH